MEGAFMKTSYVPEHALVSVSDKTGIEDFAARLVRAGVALVSTGGTAAVLRAAGLAVRDVSDITGFPEIMDGRVKTLHPRIHGGLLARRDNREHRDAMDVHGIPGIDLLVVSLYPFEDTLNAGGTFPECIENIDIGGPAMIRAAAKNHEFTAVMTDAGEYDAVISEIERTGTLAAATRRRLAAAAFARTAAYDAGIASWLSGEQEEKFPRHYTLAGSFSRQLRYGENPHQKAALYTTGRNCSGVVGARQVQGKPLSYNNYNDTDSAYSLVSAIGPGRPAAVIVKHANPCGAAVADTCKLAYERALRCDPVSAFGGIVALNRKIDAAMAEKIIRIFTEVVIAPDADEGALKIFSGKPDIRVLLGGGLSGPCPGAMEVRPLSGGFLLQEPDCVQTDRGDLEIVTRRKPDGREIADMLFGFTVAAHVMSNAIVYVRDGATTGIGAGQMNRLDSSRIAAGKAMEAAKKAGIPETLAKNSVVASDAFFPFPDGLLAAAAAGATAVIQPGGSVRDREVIAAADEAGLAMAFTGRRHFRH